MKKTWLLGCILVGTLAASAQEMDPSTLSKEEEAAVAAILANVREEETQTKREEVPQPRIEKKADLLAQSQEKNKEEIATDKEEKTPSPSSCLTVAFVDIDEAFNAHPRTVDVKEQIRLKILAKEEEVQAAKQLIQVLQAENRNLSRQLQELTPFYERVVVEAQELQPRPAEQQDTLSFDNLLNRLTFAGTDPVATSPLNTNAQTEDLTSKIAANKKIIAEREFFIDNYRYQTREEILKLEKKEVTEILQDIYSEIKTFAKKRNIGAIVRKDEVLYGEKPVNVTLDFINRLKKSKKYRKRGN